jgi:hypothetical protein
MNSIKVTSTKWWEETTYELRKIFAVDPDFHPKMFAVRNKYVISYITFSYHSSSGNLRS